MPSPGQPLAGPDFDAGGCADCHVETAREAAQHAILIARPALAAHRQRYGRQLRQHRHGGGAPEAGIHVRWVRTTVTDANGGRRRLRRPVAAARMRDGEVVPVALRSAPLLFGWGLIAKLDPDLLGAFHDPQDRDGDGISGRMARRGKAMAFLGWKNAQSSLRGQIRAALHNDMGVTAGRGGEISSAELDALAQYVARLGVPARRPMVDEQRGHLLFGRVGCADCHVPALITAPQADPAFSEQLIWPYSDMMLHDMGPGLADPGDDALAAEWRTAPLWGLGLVEKRFPQRGFLHDGRAVDIEEAILWHGGEGRAARDRFMALSRDDRNTLLTFVRAL